ncbi:MAG: DMT family transporter [Rubrivivax sp.]|nr:DMT family transporter [Rubrivivax sp.]
MLASPAQLGLGIAWMLAAVSCFAAMDTTVRHLGAAVPVLMLLILRYLTQALLMAPVLALSGLGFRSPRPGFQLMRGLLLLACSAITFIGLRYMPVAEYTAIAMLTPVLVTVLSVLLFKERISALRWALVLGAFAGALIIIRPGSGAFGWVVLWPLAGSFAYAGFQLITSHYAARENPFVTHFWTGAVGAAAVLPAWPLGAVDVPALWLALDARVQALIVLVGLLGTFGHLLLILAFGRAPASRLMPFLYLQIAMAVLLGWWALGHVPDAWAWIGMGVIAACGAATAVLNLRSAAGSRREVSAVAADTTAD